MTKVRSSMFLVGHAAPLPLAAETAALLAYASGAALSHRTAAYLHQLLPAAPAEIHLLVARGSTRARPGIRVHRASHLDRDDLTRYHGLPITTVARTLVDLAADATENELARATNEAQVQGLTTHASLVAAVHAAGSRYGVKALRSALNTQEGPTITRSEAERRFLALIDRAALPRPHMNARVAGYEVDAYWPEARLVVEIDGFAAHGTRAAFERDRSRDAELQLRGLTVLRITWRALVDRPGAVVAQVAVGLNLP